MTLFPEGKIAYLTAEREFLGHNWFGYLLEQPTLAFRIRIRARELLERWTATLEGKCRL